MIFETCVKLGTNQTGTAQIEHVRNAILKIDLSGNKKNFLNQFRLASFHSKFYLVPKIYFPAFLKLAILNLF